MDDYRPVYWTGVGRRVLKDGKPVGHVELAGDQGPHEDWLGFAIDGDGALTRGTYTQCRSAVLAHASAN